jgi:hypothetical protein
MGLLSRLKSMLPRRGAEPIAPAAPAPAAPAPPSEAPDERGERPWWDYPERPWPEELSHVPVTRIVVNNRVFLLGLDEMYRTAMKKRERGELLTCAHRVAQALKVGPASVPIEGYYTEHPQLTTYFQLMRALQGVPLARAGDVEQLPEFQRLLAVTSSPIYGRPVRENLLPQGFDPVTAALTTLPMERWTVPDLVATATTAARQSDDYSLVGLAARAGDPVVLAALRESVVLYARGVTGAALVRLEYEWTVDADLSAAAQRFVDAFNGLFGPELPPPVPKHAAVYWGAFKRADVVGRCVRLGQTPPTPDGEQRFYHWAVVAGAEDQLAVHEFWAERVWTTAEYRSAQGGSRGVPRQLVRHPDTG